MVRQRAQTAKSPSVMDVAPRGLASVFNPLPTYRFCRDERVSSFTTCRGLEIDHPGANELAHTMYAVAIVATVPRANYTSDVAGN